MRSSIRLRDIHRARSNQARLRVRTLRRIKLRAVKALRSKVAFRPVVVRTWSGEGVGHALCVDRPTFAPKVLCFATNRDETLSFLHMLFSRIETALAAPKRLPRRRTGKRKDLPRIGGYIDFSQIQYIATGAAVVLTALYDRVRKLSGRVPPTINLHQWSEAAFSTLFELGFFATLGHVVPSEVLYTQEGHVRTMFIMTGENSAELRQACERVLELSRFIDEEEPLREDVRLALNSALGEAMSNVAAHAYDETESEALTLKHWWVSASADKERRVLRVVAYDQGASIPVTLPKRSWAAILRPSALVSTLVGGHVVPYPMDADYIEFAMGEGKTQTGEPGRGEGLPQMRDLVKICGSGSLTILSRGGICCYRPEEKIVSIPLRTPIKGTLLEWEMHLPRAM